MFLTLIYSQVEFYEPSNTYTLEYSFISYPLLLTFIQDQLKLNKKLERKKWIRLYQDELGGSKDFAHEVKKSYLNFNNIIDV